METLLGLCVGVGLSAACGFRVFVPMLIVSIASYSGHVTLDSSFQWIGTPAALAAFSVATLFEVGSYYVPWVDNLLDAVATPAAIVAGTVLTASFVGDVDPFLRWTLAIIAGGSVAGATQLVSVMFRGLSTAGTGGLANPVFATAELGGSVVTSLGALASPVVMLLVVAVALLLIGRKCYQFRSKKVAV